MAGKDIQINIGAKDMASRVLRNVSRNISAMAGRMSSVATGMTGFASKIGGSIAGMAKKFAVLGGVAGVAFGFVLRTFANFDDRMAAVAAKTGATGASLDALREKAKELGASTKFSASQAAEGMEMLAQAGFSTDQILAGIGPTLSLAAAGGVGLKEAADIASDIGGAFRIPADEMGRIADVLAATATSANTDILMMGETMKFVAPIAQMTGQSLEEVSAAAGLLGNSGVKASVAGTDLKNILSKFSTVAVQKDLAAMGVSVLDSSGEMLPMMDILSDMNGAMGGMTGPQQAAKMIELFGERSAKSAAILSGTATPAIDDMRRKITDSEGAADRMAETMQTGLGGAGVKIMSAFEGVQIALVDTVKGPLIAAASSIAEFLSKVTVWIGEHVGIIRGLGVVVSIVWDATVGVVGTAISAIIGGFQSVTGEGMTFKEMMQSAIIGVVTGITFLETMLTNLPTVFSIMADTASLKMLGLGFDIIHLFTVVVPNKFQQFAAIIKNVFRDVVATVGTMFQGLIALQVDMFRKVAEFDPSGIANKIADALQTGHQFAGAMIDELEGGKSVIPNNAGERKRTPEEIAMQARISGNAAKIGADFASKLGPRLDDLNTTFAAADLESKVDSPGSGLPPPPPGSEEGEDSGAMPAAVRTADQTLQATQSRLLTRGAGSDPMLVESKRQSKVLEKIAKNTEEMKPDPKVDTTEMVLVGPA